MLEVIFIWMISFISVTYALLAYTYDLYYPALALGDVSISLYFILVLLFPLILEIGIKKRPLNELGLIRPALSSPCMAWIGFGIFFGIFTHIFEHPSPYPLSGLLWGMVTPAFLEEWFYRGMVQIKLERSMNQNAAWMISGVLFGISHLPTDFIGPLWVAGGKEVTVAVARVLGQCAFGWL
jgi:membrane protease YdiL (CAAX protease family)